MYQIVCSMNNWHIVAPDVQIPLYETENNATEILVRCVQEENCTYEVYRDFNGDKKNFAMTADGAGLHLPLSSGFLTDAGTYICQIKGTYTDGKVKISNQFTLSVGTFIGKSN